MLKYIQLTNGRTRAKVGWPEPWSKSFCHHSNSYLRLLMVNSELPPNLKCLLHHPGNIHSWRQQILAVKHTDQLTNSPALCVTLLKLPKFSGPQFPLSYKMDILLLVFSTKLLWIMYMCHIHTMHVPYIYIHIQFTHTHIFLNSF